MRNKWKYLLLFGGILGLCLAFGTVLSACIVRWSEAAFFERAAAAAAVIADSAAASEPPQQADFMAALKEPATVDLDAGREILGRYGYRGSLLTRQERGEVTFMAVFFPVLLTAGIFAVLAVRGKRERRRIDGLTDYLRQVEQGIYPTRPQSQEDRFSYLEDELYKTVSALRESREAAVHGREGLARNLADISHQLKTPLTSISLTSEMLAEKLTKRGEQKAALRILDQNKRMGALVSSLLTLSKLDAATLPLSRRLVPADELISCAVDPVNALMEAKGQSCSISCPDDIILCCDLGWTAEAVGNLVKNCCEHSPVSSVIFITVRQNPIFTELLVEDQGPGFTQEEIPHLFERFYRGTNAAKDSIGIGLALAKSIIESQDGIILAENRKEGGARFAVKLYQKPEPLSRENG